MGDRAIALLKDLEAAARLHAAPLPGGSKTDAHRQAMGFKLGDLRLVAPLGDIAEVILPPRMTSIPRVREWLLGIANVRGRLIPMVDLARFFDLPSSESAGQRRALVVEEGEVVAGLLVDQLLGMQQLADRMATELATEALGNLAPFVSRAFALGEATGYEIGLRALLNSDRFLNVAQGPVQADSREITGMQNHE